MVPTRLLGMPVQRLAGIMSWLPVGLVDRLLQATEYVAFGNLRRHGLPRREVGPATLLAREGVAPAIDDGFVAALKAGDVTLVPAVARFDEDAVVLADGARLQPDVVVCATGYSPGLEQVVGHLGVLDNRGIPRRQGEEPALPGLWFLGMQPRIYGGFHAARRDSRRLAVRISRDLA